MDLEREFSLSESIIHLNHAAVAPWPQRTVDAVTRFAKENAELGSRNYPQWLLLQSRLREQLQQLINAPSWKDVALLKNTSEGLSVIAFGLTWNTGDNIVSSNEEFPSNRVVWEALASEGVELRQAEIGSVDDPEAALFACVDANTRMIAVSSVQFGSGLALDLKRIGQFCRERGILFCVDAIQSIGALRMDVQDIKADFVVADGHKWMLGPEGVALFYCRPELRDKLQLRQYGWHMIEHNSDYDRRDWQPANSARRFECGSPNMLGVHALSASLSLLEDVGMERVQQQLLHRSELLFEAIRAQPKLELLTDTATDRYAGIVRFAHRHLDPQVVYKYLMNQGVLCAQRAGGVRFSPHFYTPEEKIIQAVELAASAA